MTDVVQTVMRTRKDALDRVRSAVAGARKAGHAVTMQGVTSDALNAAAEHLEREHNGGVRYPDGRPPPGRLAGDRTNKHGARKRP